MVKKIAYKWIALSCTTLGALFSVLSSSTLIIVLPDIMKDLHADMDIIIWTVMIYLLALTILVPTIGRIADMIGRKKLYVSGFIVFTIGSLLCGISATGWELIVFRFVQAIGGSLLVANSTPIVTDAFPKQELGKAMGINGMVISVAFVIGPILGGALVSAGWRSIFFFNLPIGVLGTFWAAFQLKELDVLPAKQTFDWKGTGAFTVSMTSLLIALTFGGFTGWLNPPIIALFVLTVLFMVLFIRIESKTAQPMLDLSLFKTRMLAFAFSSNLLNGIARGAVTFLLVFYFQGIKGFDPVLAGMLLAPFAAFMMIMAPLSGWFSDRYGSRGLSSIGLFISAIGLLGMVGISAQTSILEVSVWISIIGLGSGIFFSPNTSAIMGAVPVERRGIAAGVRTMMNNAGSVISIAISMAIISSSITQEALQGLFTGTQVGSKGIAVDHFIDGLKTAFLISFIISLIATVISYLRGNEQRQGHLLMEKNFRRKGRMRNGDIHIKEITTGDQLEKLVGVLQAAFGTVAEKFHLTRENAPSNPAFITCAILKKSLDRGLIMFGLFLRGELIGCIGIEDSKKGNVFFIERVAVLPEHRHNGFGKKLMDFAFQMIKERNGRKISIGIIDENTVLKEWYERQGFSPVAVKQFPHLPFTVAFLEKEITQRRR